MDTIFVALQYWVDDKLDMSTLEWVFEHFQNDNLKIVLTTWYAGNDNYRNRFTNAAQTTYLPRCRTKQFQAEILTPQASTEREILSDLLTKHGMTKLVINTQSRSYITQALDANPNSSCKIWFLQQSVGKLNAIWQVGPDIQDSDMQVEKFKKMANDETIRRKDVEKKLAIVTEEAKTNEQNNERLTQVIGQLKKGKAQSTYITYQELELATNNFSDALKIGEGGNGYMYKGTFRGTSVAIKKFKNQDKKTLSEFEKEVDILSTVRHPNLVTLIGACLKPLSLVYEFLSNGSLYDYLNNEDMPLLWDARTRIIAEICLALIFLHLNKPNPIIHGDLRPDNIFLDSILTSKLSDFGLVKQSSTNYNNLYGPMDDRLMAYMDPQFFGTRTMTSESDVYSFGMIIVRLLTGKYSLGIQEKLAKSMKNGELQTMIDESAGEWPLNQAEEMAKIGIWCARELRSDRPNLVCDVWPVIDRVLKLNVII